MSSTGCPPAVTRKTTSADCAPCEMSTVTVFGFWNISDSIMMLVILSRNVPCYSQLLLPPVSARMWPTVRALCFPFFSSKKFSFCFISFILRAVLLHQSLWYSLSIFHALEQFPQDLISSRLSEAVLCSGASVCKQERLSSLAAQRICYSKSISWSSLLLLEFRIMHTYIFARSYLTSGCKTQWHIWHLPLQYWICCWKNTQKTSHLISSFHYFVDFVAQGSWKEWGIFQFF